VAGDDRRRDPGGIVRGLMPSTSFSGCLASRAPPTNGGRSPPPIGRSRAGSDRPATQPRSDRARLPHAALDRAPPCRVFLGPEGVWITSRSVCSEPLASPHCSTPCCSLARKFSDYLSILLEMLRRRDDAVRDALGSVSLRALATSASASDAWRSLLSGRERAA
jgi:hypothetical protein